MDLKQDIYEELLKWKKAGTGKIFEVRGAPRQDKALHEAYFLKYWLSFCKI